MKKSALFLIVAIVTLLSCQKETLVADPSDEHVVFTCTIADPDTKTTVGLENSDEVKIYWEAGDVVTIKDSKRNSAIYEVQSGAGTTSATFVWKSGETLLTTGPYTAVYYQRASSLIQMRNQPNSVVVFMNGSGETPDKLLFKIYVESILKITLNDPTHTVKHIMVSNATESFAMTCPTRVSIANPTDFYLQVAPGTYTNLKVYDGDGHVAEKILNPGLVVTKETLKKATLTSTLNFIPIEGALPGKFSVSADKQVYFSKGNLWCDTSKNPVKWDFEPHQYDYRTWQYRNSCADGVTDTRGTAASHVGALHWASTPEFSYTEKHMDYANENLGDLCFVNRYSLVSVNWKALSDVEWDYLLNNRPGAASKVGYATVGPVKGIIILPDEFTDPMKNGGNAAFVPAPATGWDSNVYQIGAEWDAMEAAGAVFLPAFGWRSDTAVYSTDVEGRYWTTTADWVTDSVTESNAKHRARYVLFNSGSIVCTKPSNRGVGYGLRLVTE